jgi:anti-sigma regulatory factor (Ser/Thr protein kinase)
MPPTARAAGTTAAPGITWARTFPAVPAQVREARRFLAGLLDGGPAAGDALICLSELVSNAVVHSRSSQAGGTFTVRVQLAGQRLRVEVCDQGGPWHSPGRASSGEPGGRGLLIVGQLASRWGCEGHSHAGWTVWFELEPAAEHRHVPHG